MSRHPYGTLYECDVCGTTVAHEIATARPDAWFEFPGGLAMPGGRVILDICPKCLLAPFGAVIGMVMANANGK